MKPLEQIEVPPITAEYAERVWQGVRAGALAQPAKRKRAPLVYSLVAVVTVAAAAVAFSISRPHEPELWVGKSIETTEQASRFRLKDGSVTDLDARSQLELVAQEAQAVRLLLSHGRASFDVTPKPSRRFEVLTPSVVVRVVGTRFSVEQEQRSAGHQTRVSVSRGKVQVLERATGALITELTAGQTWSDLEPTEVEAAKPPVLAPLAASNAPSSPTPSAEVARAASPDQLLEQANQARARGDYAQAIAKYSELTRRFPNHPSASLAALEMGRLSMYSENDPAAAARSLERSLQGNEPGLQEDSLSRLVEAYEQNADVSRCEKAKATYLKRYPNGMHVAEVRARCLALKKK